MHQARNHARHEIEGFANLMPESGAQQAIRGILANLSFGGFCVRANHRLEPGSVVAFDVLTEVCGEHLTGKGKVKYSNELKRHDSSFVIGIEFLEVNKPLVINCMDLHKAQLLRRKQEYAKPKQKYEGPF
ncbi:MAG TPA: PilZ domain-containing protein [Patescibacteria group bacterium]|nr:PilZ domain-containing protein [Patescibacteria group bacterium]